MDSIGYLGIFVALVGAIGALWLGLAHRRASALRAAARRWLDAPGRMVSADVDQRGSVTTATRYTYYVPLVRYSYVVNGREREGSRLRFGMPRSRSRGGA